MGQFTILMNNGTKGLTITNRIKLHQHESLVDKIVFICEYEYAKDIDLRDFSCSLYWLDPTNVAHVDELEKEEDVYKDKYQRYFLPVKTLLNRFAGDIEAKLVFTKMDYETEKRYKLETDTIIIPISTISDFFAVIPDESFNGIDNRIDTLQSKVDELAAIADIYDKSKADSLTLDQHTNELQLTARGDKIGEPVVIDLIDEMDKELDELDGKVDGVIDLDDIDWENVDL